jgi:cell wall assembly regulator SMI1
MATSSGGLEGLLHRLETELARLGVDLARHAAPGASDAQLNEADRMLGFRLPDDVRTLYRWHNGGVDRVAENAKSPTLAVSPAWYLISLDQAVKDYLFGRRLEEDMYREEHRLPPHAALPTDDPMLAQRLFPLFQSITDATLVAVIEPGVAAQPGVDLLWEATDMPIEVPAVESVADLIVVFIEVASSGEAIVRAHGELDFANSEVPTRFRHLNVF